MLMRASGNKPRNNRNPGPNGPTGASQVAISGVLLERQLAR